MSAPRKGAPAMLSDKQVEWLYKKFEAISKAHNNYLYLLLFAFVFSFVTFIGTSDPKVSLLGSEVNRTLVLAGSAVLGAWLIVAYCGNYDMGEAILKSLAATLRCEYEDLHIVDTHPNLFDFAQYSRSEKARARGPVSRCSVQLLYPAALAFAWGWFGFLTLVELVQPGGIWATKVLAIISLVTLFVGFRRLRDFVGRRWRTFLATEKVLRAKEVS